MSFALPQFMQSPWNNLVWTAIDNDTDTRTSLIIYNGLANTLPLDTGQYEVNCIMMHQAEKQLYSNIGTVDTPSWAPFGPGSQYPQPLVPGTFLFTDGSTVYWSTALVGQVQYNAVNLNQYGIINFKNFLVASNDVPNTRINVDLDVVALANDTTFINTLLANSAFISGISTALLALSSFISSLISTLLANSTFISGIVNIVNNNGSIQIDLSTQVTGLLNGSYIDQSTLNLGSIGGTLDLSTQVTNTLGLNHGGTGANLSDPNYDAVWVWDDTTNATRLAHISGLTYNSATNTLTAQSGQISVINPSYFDDFLSVFPTTLTTGTSTLPVNNEFQVGSLNWIPYGSASGGVNIGFAKNGSGSNIGIFTLKSDTGNSSFIQLGLTGIYPIPDVMKNGAVYQFIAVPRTSSNAGAYGFVGIGRYFSGGNNSFRVVFDKDTSTLIFETRDGTTTQSTTLGAFSYGTSYNVVFSTTPTDVSVSVNGGATTTHSTNVPVAGTGATATALSFSQFELDIDLFSMYYPGLTR